MFVVLFSVFYVIIRNLLTVGNINIIRDDFMQLEAKTRKQLQDDTTQ